jgi:[lysine-biosynthesis-protein LysW]---L-2-aminoadipate ligase
VRPVDFPAGATLPMSVGLQVFMCIRYNTARRSRLSLSWESAALEHRLQHERNVMVIFIVLNVSGGYSRRIARAVQRNGCQTGFFSWKGFDYSIIRQLDRHGDVIFFRTGALPAVRIAQAFEEAGFTVVNDHRYIQLSAHKYLANVHAQANGIPIPKLNARAKKDNFELLSLYLKQHKSLVAKPILSRDMGRFVYRVRTNDDLRQLVAIPGSHILIQSEVKFDRLVRTVVTRNGMLTEATAYDTAHNTWKATVCDNPLARHYKDVPGELADLAKKTIRVFGGDIAYIDYFETPDGFVLNEINHSCGLNEQERITGYPIAASLATYLASIQRSLTESRQHIRPRTVSS